MPGSRDRFSEIWDDWNHSAYKDFWFGELEEDLPFCNALWDRGNCVVTTQQNQDWIGKECIPAGYGRQCLRDTARTGWRADPDPYQFPRHYENAGAGH